MVGAATDDDNFVTADVATGWSSFPPPPLPQSPWIPPRAVSIRSINAEDAMVIGSKAVGVGVVVVVDGIRVVIISERGYNDMYGC